MSDDRSVLVLGAGAAGLVCAREAALRGHAVTVVDHQTLPGRKLAITGGGRCNVTNREVLPERFISTNRHFVKSALARFGMWDTITMLAEGDITTHERERGELFCDVRATVLVDLLHQRASSAGVRFVWGQRVEGLQRVPKGGFLLRCTTTTRSAQRVVVATGGLSYASVGATGVGHDIARSFGLPVVEPRPGLVPLLWSADDRGRFGALAGNALEVRASCPGSPSFQANMLFTHRGVSGPAILQVSSYWRPGSVVKVDLLPKLDLRAALAEARSTRPRAMLRSTLGQWLPRGLVKALEGQEVQVVPTAQLSDHGIEQVAAALHGFSWQPAGTAGWATAEVTVGGVDTRAISSKTMEAREVPGLYFVGEVLDVTGWLGGYNLQWAWSSGWCCGRSA